MVELPALSKPGFIGLRLHAEKRLDLKVGYDCNNNCLFCVVADKRRFGRKTTLEIKRELLSSFKEGAKEVVLTGGEVTIRDDIFEIISFARKTGYKGILVQSNGRKFASFKFTKEMLFAGMTSFLPALHGHNAKIHDGLTCRPGSWRQIVTGIYHARKLGIKILVNTVVTKQNYRHLSQIANLLVKLKVNQFQFAFVHMMGNALKNYRAIVPRMSLAAPHIKKGLDIGIKANLRVFVEAVPFCLMAGYENCISDFYLPPTQIKEVGWQIDNFEIVRKNEAKKKFASCKKCAWFTVCEGTWKEYPELFGKKEFKPVLIKHN